MKAISLWQPWAQWVSIGWKLIETRDHDRFKGLVNQRIAIHSAKKWDNNAFRIAGSRLKQSYQEITLDRLRLLEPAIVCTAFVKKSYWDNKVPEFLRLATEGWALCPIDNKYLLIFTDIIAFKPIPWRGHQGIFNVPDEIIRGAR